MHLPTLSYSQTALRPAWADLPASFREALEHRLGSTVTDVRGNRCGFTPGFVALLTTASGERHFVKAASQDTGFARSYAREAKFTAVLPAGIAAPRLRWSAEVADHIVLCSEPIEGARTPELPWVPAELNSALETLAQAAALLTEPSPELLAAEPASFGEVLDFYLNKWRTGQASSPFEGRLTELIALETRFDELTRQSTSLIHSDLRLDNFVIDSNGRAWICDWTPTFGPPFFDLISLLLSAEASGLDTDALFHAHPTTRGLPPDALDAGLTAFAGYYLYAGGQPEIETSPEVRNHQRYYGELTLRWLARRQGWA